MPTTKPPKLDTAEFDKGWVAGYEQCKLDNRYPRDLLKTVRQFMCTVSLVTAHHNVGAKIPKRYLDNLASTQQEIEQILETFN